MEFHMPTIPKIVEFHTPKILEFHMQEIPQNRGVPHPQNRGVSHPQIPKNPGVPGLGKGTGVIPLIDVVHQQPQVPEQVPAAPGERQHPGVPVAKNSPKSGNSKCQKFPKIVEFHVPNISKILEFHMPEIPQNHGAPHPKHPQIPGVLRPKIPPDPGVPRPKNSSKSWSSISKKFPKIMEFQSSYSQLLAATCLTKLVSRTNNPLPLEQRIDIRNYVLNYLATRPKLATFVTQALIQLYARITKLGWFDCQKDEYVFRNVINDVTRFLQVPAGQVPSSEFPEFTKIQEFSGGVKEFGLFRSDAVSRGCRGEKAT
ncbi:hypothetical protein HGM15179_018068 [Zosterops borbonicus]|uniref:Importin N-terminal domain-containing protein n=1 Tax=Zosterops borbonicus TaxID=364589 RepID=A0A8K1FZS7_9PASS|nr:hypothetical protein HGM15179_018068 [Zosterops borbonicus]